MLRKCARWTSNSRYDYVGTPHYAASQARLRVRKFTVAAASHPAHIDLTSTSRPPQGLAHGGGTRLRDRRAYGRSRVLGRNPGTRRTGLACSKANASLMSVGSLRGVLHIEVDQVCQRAHLGAWTRGEIGGDPGLELILQHQSLGSDISALEVGAQLGMGGDLDVVDQLSAALAQNLERLGEHAIGVLAVFGVELSRDADACSAQRVGLQILTVIFSRFGNGAQYRGRIRHRAR